MKALKFVVSLLTMLIINSCTNKVEVEEEIEIPPHIFLSSGIYPLGVYSCLQELLISFQDASGNDLVKGIGFWAEYSHDVTGGNTHAWGTVKSELYTLECDYEENPLVYPRKLPYPIGLRKGKPFSKKYPDLDCNYDYLYFQVAACVYGRDPFRDPPPDDALFFEKITYKLTCPYLFGDNKVHEIITQWRLLEGTEFPVCYHIELGGKEFTEISYIYDILIPGIYYGSVNPYSIATIVLDR